MSTSEPSFRELRGVYEVRRPVHSAGFEPGDYIIIGASDDSPVTLVRHLDLEAVDCELLRKAGTIEFVADLVRPRPGQPKPPKRKRRSTPKAKARRVRRGGLRLAP